MKINIFRTRKRTLLCHQQHQLAIYGNMYMRETHQHFMHKFHVFLSHNDASYAAHSTLINHIHECIFREVNTNNEQVTNYQSS